MKLITPQTYEITFDDVLLLPKYSDIPIEKESEYCDVSTKISKDLSIKLPIISSPMAGVTEMEMAIEMAKHGGVGIIHFFMNFDEQIHQVKKVKSKKHMVGASVADFSDKGFEHCLNLIESGADLISLESLQANNFEMLNFIRRLRKMNTNIQISAAHVVTAEATAALIKAGASCIRVGIGGGSHCTTRLITGIGRPQLSAVYECAKVAKKYKVPIISDTGIRYPGDIVKALAFGASSVMIGSLLTGTDMTPGEIIKKHGKLYKFSSGNASQDRNYLHPRPDIVTTFKSIVKKMLGYEKENYKARRVLEEGVANLIPFKGSTAEVLTGLEMSLKRSMWYLGSRNISDIQKKSEVVICSPLTMAESKPRI